jgi:hypothetical protein
MLGMKEKEEGMTAAPRGAAEEDDEEELDVEVADVSSSFEWSEVEKRLLPVLVLDDDLRESVCEEVAEGASLSLSSSSSSGR